MSSNIHNRLKFGKLSRDVLEELDENINSLFRTFLYHLCPFEHFTFAEHFAILRLNSI